MLRILIFAWLIIAPLSYYLFASSQSDVVDALIVDAQNKSVDGIADRIDWPKIRAFVKQDLKGTKRAMGGYGALIGPDSSKINAIVDHYLQPHNIQSAYFFKDALFSNVQEKDFIRSVSYVPYLGFQVTLGYPKNAENDLNVPEALQDRLKVKFVFRLDGWRWMIQEMYVPIYMVPPQIYTQDQLRQMDHNASFRP